MKRLISIIIISILLTTASCSKKDDTIKVRIGIIRVPNDTTVAIQTNIFKSYFDDKGVETEFIFFDSGVAANQAFASGAIDFAEMGYTNAVVALSKNLPVKLIWIHEVIGESEALIARDPSIKTVTDLKGKKIATIFNSTAHLSLLKTLELNGMSAADVTLLNMNTAEIVAAWERGDLDAAYTWEPTLTQIKQDRTPLMTSAELAKLGVMTTNVRLVRTAFAEKHPELVADFISALSDAGDLYRSSPQTAITAASTSLGISYHDAETQMEGTRWLTRGEAISTDFLGDNGAFLDIFLDTAKYWKEQDFIDRMPTVEEIRAFIDPSFIKLSMERNP